MIRLGDILADYHDKWETPLDDRFGSRLAQFLTNEQLTRIGYERDTKDYTPERWNETNVLAQLKKDVAFGWEKACNERGISSSLMVDVVQKWCDVLENGLEYDPNYTDYGKAFLKTVNDYYDWHITDYDAAEPNYAEKMMAEGYNVITVDPKEDK